MRCEQVIDEAEGRFGNGYPFLIGIFQRLYQGRSVRQMSVGTGNAPDEVRQSGVYLHPADRPLLTGQPGEFEVMQSELP